MGLERFSLAGRIALVTGAGKGIGRAIALGLADAGADVALASRTVADLEQVASDVQAMGRRAITVSTDVSNELSAAALVERTLGQYGRVDVLVNAAGISPIYKRAEQISSTEWDEVLAVNLDGAFFCATAAGRAMIAERSGSIINLASVGARVALPRLAAYCASKGGVAQLTKVLAVEWARYNIRVNAIAPGYVETEMTRGMVENPSLREMLVNRTPLGRLAKPEEIVGAAIFLASDAASYVTGQTLFVDGGWTAI